MKTWKGIDWGYKNETQWYDTRKAEWANREKYHYQKPGMFRTWGEVFGKLLMIASPFMFVYLIWILWFK